MNLANNKSITLTSVGGKETVEMELMEENQAQSEYSLF